jgi:hypothetical protein
MAAHTNPFHSARDCDDTCSGCPACYRATGDTCCQRCCPHWRENRQAEAADDAVVHLEDEDGTPLCDEADADTPLQLVGFGPDCSEPTLNEEHVGRTLCAVCVRAWRDEQEEERS